MFFEKCKTLEKKPIIVYIFVSEKRVLVFIASELLFIPNEPFAGFVSAK